MFLRCIHVFWSSQPYPGIEGTAFVLQVRKQRLRQCQNLGQGHLASASLHRDGIRVLGVWSLNHLYCIIADTWTLFQRVCPPESCYLKCGRWTGNIAITQEMVRDGVKLEVSEALVQSRLSKMIRSPEELLKRRKDAICQHFATILPGYKCRCSFILQGHFKEFILRCSSRCKMACPHWSVIWDSKSVEWT